MKRHNKSHYQDCRRKIRYRTEHEALTQIRKIHDKGRDTYLDVYYCDNCNGWHITSREFKNDY